MVSDDAAALEVVGQAGGLKDSLPKGGMHICAGTHSVAAIAKLKAIHGEAGQILIASPVLGRPEVVAAGNASMLVGGPQQNVKLCGRCSMLLRGASSNPAPSRSPRLPSRSPTILCSAAPLKRSAKGLR